MVDVVALNCPVCGAPVTTGSDRCSYCRSVLALKTDHPRIDPASINRSVINEHIDRLRQQLKADSSDVSAHYGLGVAYYNLGLTEAAVDSLERACRLTPENPHIHTQLAVAFRAAIKDGNERARDEQIEHIRYALRLDDRNVEALLLGADLAPADLSWDQAADYAERAWHIDPAKADLTYRRVLVGWINDHQHRGDVTDAMWHRIETFSPTLSRELRGEPLGRAGSPYTPARQSGVDAGRPTTSDRVRNTALWFVIGVVIAFIGLCIGTSMQPSTDPSAWYGFVYLLLIMLPFVLAIRGWVKTKDD